MKLLMVLDGVDFPLAPNPRLACLTAGQLAKMGHTVHILYLAGFEKDLPSLPEDKNLLLLPQFFPAEAKMEEILEHGAPGGTPVVRRLLRLAAHPLCAWAAVRRILLYKPARVDACRRRMEELCRQNGYQAVVTVNAPYHSASALVQADIKARKYAWQMDPLEDNPSSQGKDAYALELALCEKADGLFITREMSRIFDQPGHPLARHKEKMQVLEFPCFTPLAETSTPTPKDPQGPVRVVFVGSLYKELRTPYFALELFAALNDPGLELVLVGGGWENYPESLTQKAKEILGSRLVITGPLPPDKARAYTQSADILLNLGNASDAQMPSKIFEYFSTGKPVLTLAKSYTDPSLPYLEQYPLSLILQEKDGLTPAAAEKARAFLLQNAGRRCQPDEINRLYQNNTPQAVASALIQRMDGCRP